MICGGVYEKETTELVHQLQAEGIILVVAKGNRGSGFSIALSNPLVLVQLADVLRSVADEIERDLKNSS